MRKRANRFHIRTLFASILIVRELSEYMKLLCVDEKSNFQRKINGLSLLVLMVIDMSQVIDAERISIIMSDRIALVIGNSNYQYVEPLKILKMMLMI